MCGIVGIVSKNYGFWSEHDDLFEEMLYLDGPRGMDSTGVFVVNKKNEVAISKQATNPGLYFQTDSWKTIKKRIESNAHIVIGHNRKATTGSVVSKNAHPFAKDHIILVHNGYIANAKSIDKEVEVDSEAIVTALLQDDDPLKGLKQLFGAYAIVWYNKKTRKLYMARNKERPLAMAHSDNHMLIASEKTMLNWIMERNRLNQFKVAQDLKEDILYELSFKPFQMKEANIVKYEPLPQKPYMDHGSVYSNGKTTLEGDQSVNDELTETERLALENMTPDDSLSKIQGDLMHGSPTDTVESLERKVTVLRRIYPFGSTALFWPSQLQEDGLPTHRYVRIRGGMWVPSKPVWNATIIIPAKEDREDYLNVEVPLLVKIQSMSRRNKDIWFNLESMTKAKNIVKSANGARLSEEEWTMICNMRVCATCNKAPTIQEIKQTEVLRKGCTYEITCARCFSEVYKGTSVHDSGKPEINT